ncbi:MULTISPECIES: DnaD domain-containing protein [Bacillus]|uniref:DnaD domain-containing protein n=1 Tax=Bacillus TaxID=1386 RepID=UPI00119D8F19|nr:DnaD domain protein [Bacillus licheniformis]MDE1367489.1 DnaD domain protein [Bacillus licheniformis]MDE1374982.1 DnaD domain protein [Bacillus licheniformis]MDZ5538876.1 DnaD domain protein [Bacillus licheniformis]
MDMQGMGCVVLPRLPFKDERDEIIYDHLFKRAEYRQGKELDIGQTIIKITHLAGRFNWSAVQIKYSLDRMARQGYLKIDRLPQKRGFIVTIVNYAEYTRFENYKKKKAPVSDPTEGKEEDKNMKTNPFQFFEDEGFGLLSSFLADMLKGLIDDYGEEKVLDAMKEAVKRNARNMAYVQRILQSNELKSKEWGNDYQAKKARKQSDQYKHGISKGDAKPSGKISPLFGPGRIRRKG